MYINYVVSHNLRGGDNQNNEDMVVNNYSLVRFEDNPLVIEVYTENHYAIIAVIAQWFSVYINIPEEAGVDKGNTYHNVTTNIKTTHNKNSTNTPNPEQGQDGITPENSEEFEMTKDINNKLYRPYENLEFGGSEVTQIMEKRVSDI